LNKTTFIFAALLCLTFAAFASASIIANYLVPSNVTVTAAPGITCYNADGTGVTTTINWGDLQIGTSKTYGIFIKNTGGGNVWILPAQSLTTQSLSSGLALSWDLSQATELTPGEQTGTITLTLTATSSATTGPSLSFNIIINAYSTSSG
jgi:hypothetical protein